MMLVGGVVANGLSGTILLLVTGTTNRVRGRVGERTQELSLQNEVLRTVLTRCLYVYSGRIGS